MTGKFAAKTEQPRCVPGVKGRGIDPSMNYSVKTLAVSGTANLKWRAMTAADLAAIQQLADTQHVYLPERPEVFAEKFELFRDGCLVLVQEGTIVGYCFISPVASPRHPTARHPVASSSAVPGMSVSPRPGNRTTSARKRRHRHSGRVPRQPRTARKSVTSRTRVSLRDLSPLDTVWLRDRVRRGSRRPPPNLRRYGVLHDPGRGRIGSLAPAVAATSQLPRSGYLRKPEWPPKPWLSGMRASAKSSALLKWVWIDPSREAN
jgi:hypothetical protein